MRLACRVQTTKKKKVNGKVKFSGTRFLKNTQSMTYFLSYLFNVHATTLLVHQSKYFDQWPALRSYPVAFGLHVQRILPKLIKGTSAKPQLPIEPDGGWDVPKLFQTMQFNLNDWEEAKLIECCTYLRGSKALKVPEKWKRVFPNYRDLGGE